MVMFNSSNLDPWIINSSMLNSTSARWVTPNNQVYYVEELCAPFIHQLSRAYLTVAIYNLFYSFIWFYLKNRDDKVFFDIELEGGFRFKFGVRELRSFLDTIFFMLNFFVIGYWLVIKYAGTFTGLPFMRWFT